MKCFATDTGFADSCMKPSKDFRLIHAFLHATSHCGPGCRAGRVCSSWEHRTCANHNCSDGKNHGVEGINDSSVKHTNLQQTLLVRREPRQRFQTDAHLTQGCCLSRKSIVAIVRATQMLQKSTIPQSPWYRPFHPDYRSSNSFSSRFAMLRSLHQSTSPYEHTRAS